MMMAATYSRVCVVVSEMQDELNVDSLFSVRGTTAVVTGGLRGIGAMITRTLLCNGVRVIAVSRRASQADADALVARCGGGVDAAQLVAVQADITSDDGLAAMLAALKVAAVRRVHLLVNNSGAVWAEPFEAFSRHAWKKVLDLNLESVFNVTRALLPLLEASGDGRVVNIGSIDGLAVRDVPHYSYAASKAAVHMLTRSMAWHFARDRRCVTVNAIAAGLFPSDMTKGLIHAVGGLDKFAADIPLRRAGHAKDIGAAVLWLASPGGAWITGTIITVDGGALLKSNM
jgi:NAD(P)-dependent dehydrogenase (short-subunit alcohol dehydrogenase family)